MNEPVIDKEGNKFWYINYKLHRLDGPAVICPVGSQYWYKHGLLHREDGPAVKTNTYEEWYINGKKHRVDGPAYKRFINNRIEEYWYINDKLHRENGPAIINRNYKAWYKNGELHRIDGPAIQDNTSDYYYFFGEHYNNEDRLKSVVKKINQFTAKLKLKYRRKINLEIYNNTNICKDICNLVSKYVI